MIAVIILIAICYSIMAFYVQETRAPIMRFPYKSVQVSAFAPIIVFCDRCVPFFLTS